MVKNKLGFWSMLSKFNKKKGYNRSIRKAFMKALEEEGTPIPTGNHQIFSFLTYILMKAYFRYYKWFTRDIAFRRGFTKFMLYSLDIFLPTDAKEAYEETKKEMMKIGQT